MADVYLNDIDKNSVSWLAELTLGGLIPPADVDGRSIADVSPEDLQGYRQCHFFAGIGGWPLAFKTAGWPDGLPAWSASCPCQPFSSMSRNRKKFDDERHLWPVLWRLARELRPAVLVGEQIAGSAGLEWLARVRADLEDGGYAVVAADLPAAGVSAPHVRNRLYWAAVLADSYREHAHQAVAGGVPPGEIPRADVRPGAPVAPRDPWASAGILGRGELGRRRIPGAAVRLAYGLPPRVDYGRRACSRLVHGYGNAIVPQVAAKFLQALLGAISETPELGDAKPQGGLLDLLS